MMSKDEQGFPYDAFSSMLAYFAYILHGYFMHMWADPDK